LQNESVRSIEYRVKKRLDMERIHNFGTVLVKREKWCRSRVCLCDKVAGYNSTVAASATLSRDKVAHSCNKSAGVTSVLVNNNVIMAVLYNSTRQQTTTATVSSLRKILRSTESLKQGFLHLKFLFLTLNTATRIARGA